MRQGILNSTIAAAAGAKNVTPRTFMIGKQEEEAADAGDLARLLGVAPAP